MKINISGVLAKKGLMYLLIVGLFSGNLQALDFFEQNATKIKYALAAGLGISVVWAVYERMSKNTVKRENIKLELENNKLGQEVNSLKSDENIKEYIVKVSDFVGKWKNFLAEVNDCMKDQGKTQEEFAKDAITFIYHHVNKYSLSLDEYLKRLSKTIDDLSNNMNELSIKAQGLKNKSDLIESATKLTSLIRIVLEHMQNYAALVETHKDYLKLVFFLHPGIEREYSQEINYAYAQTADWNQVIDQIIKSKNNQVLFPYLFYVQDLTVRLKTLSTLLSNLSRFKVYPFQKEQIDRAQYVHDALQVIVSYISSSDILTREKNAKIEHDKKQQYVQADIEERKERLRLETKEKEAKIAQEKILAETKLLDQKNREKHLANERAQIEKEKKELDSRSQENALQLARIHEGYGIKKALDENNNKWRTDCDSLNVNHKKELQNRDFELKNLKNKLSDYDNLDAKNKKEIQKRDNELKTLRIKLSSLESDIRGTHSNRTDLERKARNLEIKISNVSHALDALTRKVNNPPFNPEMVDMLPGYINSLRQEVRQLKTLIS